MLGSGNTHHATSTWHEALPIVKTAYGGRNRIVFEARFCHILNEVTHVKKFVKPIIVIGGALSGTLCAVYFFENLPMQIEVERWERSHPGRKMFYQSGIMHTAVENIECNLLRMPPYAADDAAALYRRLCYHK